MTGFLINNNSISELYENTNDSTILYLLGGIFCAVVGSTIAFWRNEQHSLLKGMSKEADYNNDLVTDNYMRFLSNKPEETARPNIVTMRWVTRDQPGYSLLKNPTLMASPLHLTNTIYGTHITNSRNILTRMRNEIGFGHLMYRQYHFPMDFDRVNVYHRACLVQAHMCGDDRPNSPEVGLVQDTDIHNDWARFPINSRLRVGILCKWPATSNYPNGSAP